MRTWIRTCAVLASVLGAVSTSAAQPSTRGFIELAGGIAQPIGDDDYTELIDTSFKLALRGGAWLSGDRGTRLGLEVGADYTFANFDGPNVDARRLRLTGGFRGLVAVGGGLGLMVRVAAGIDYASYEGDVIGFTFDGTDVGFAVEAGGGVIFHIARTMYVGGQVAVPIGFHDAEDEGIDFTSIDVDVLVVLGLGF